MQGRAPVVPIPSEVFHVNYGMGHVSHGASCPLLELMFPLLG